MGLHGAASIRASVTQFTHLSRFPSVKLDVDIDTLVPEADMAQEPDSLAFRFAVVLALALIVLILATWTAPPHPGDDTATPIPHSNAIYRAQHLNLF
jgi:hypothetical protein